MTRIPYKPYLERTPDTQYSDLLRFIRNSPETFLAKNPYQVRGRWTNLDTPTLSYKFENGFPIITERRIPFWKKSITEILLFIRGVRDLKTMTDSGCEWWGDWVSPEQCAYFKLQPGDLGPGSYGPNLKHLPDGTPEGFDQVENLVQSLKDRPGINTHVITTWFPPLDMQHSTLQRQVAVAPCHGTIIQCTVIDGEKLVLTMVQRSQDVAVGGVTNIIQYAALCIALAHVCGYTPYKFVLRINDAQIYENQVEKVDELLTEDITGKQIRSPYRFPRLMLTEEGQMITNIFDFTADHFELWDYESHTPMEIPTTL
jgi:thymidylate synthase